MSSLNVVSSEIDLLFIFFTSCLVLLCLSVFPSLWISHGCKRSMLGENFNSSSEAVFVEEGIPAI